MKRITLKVEEEFHQAVKEEAERQGHTITWVVKTLLKKWLEESRKKEQESGKQS